MAQQQTLSSAHCIVYINGKKINEVQQVDWAIDYGEKEIFGVDSHFAQEIAVTRVSVQGSITIFRLKNSNGLQSANIRPLIFDVAKSPYISIRVQDRSTGEDIFFVPQAKTTRERVSITAKGSVKLSFSFSGTQPQQPLDRV